MQSRTWAWVFLALGAFVVHAHTTLLYLWQLVGIPGAYPLIATEGPLLALAGFTPPIGALVMVIGGLIYGRETEEVAR